VPLGSENVLPLSLPMVQVHVPGPDTAVHWKATSVTVHGPLQQLTVQEVLLMVLPPHVPVSGS
jgi:hypothetical protein